MTCSLYDGIVLKYRILVHTWTSCTLKGMVLERIFCAATFSTF